MDYPYPTRYCDDRLQPGHHPNVLHTKPVFREIVNTFCQEDDVVHQIPEQVRPRLQQTVKINCDIQCGDPAVKISGSGPERKKDL